MPRLAKRQFQSIAGGRRRRANCSMAVVSNTSVHTYDYRHVQRREPKQRRWSRLRWSQLHQAKISSTALLMSRGPFLWNGGVRLTRKQSRDYSSSSRAHQHCGCPPAGSAHDATGGRPGHQRLDASRSHRCRRGLRPLASMSQDQGSPSHLRGLAALQGVVSRRAGPR